MAKISAGILVYRRTSAGGFEVLLAHPGGPFFARKDEGAWTIPKGEPASGEPLLAAAIRELQEEIGLQVQPPLPELGPVRQKGGKTIHAWAADADFDCASLRSNTFQLEWPPKSGKIAEFPEIDRAAWFSREEAIRKINPGQKPLIEELERKLGTGNAICEKAS